jgi:hypothetical protein
VSAPVPDSRPGELVAVELGEYELEEPWGRLAEIARGLEHVELDGPSPPSVIRAFAIKDRTIRSSSIICKTVEDAVKLARFLDAHLAEARRFLLDRNDPEHARLRALETDARGALCHVAWSFSTGDTDAVLASTASVERLHGGFIGQFSPVELVDATLEPDAEGGKGVLAASTLDAMTVLPSGVDARPLGNGVEVVVRLDVRGPAGPGYRLAQLEAARALVHALTEAKDG